VNADGVGVGNATLENAGLKNVGKNMAVVEWLN